MKENNMSINIERVQNGYYVSTDEDTYVFEDVCDSKLVDSKGNDLQTVQRLLYFIMEYFGIYNSKRETYGIVISIEDESRNEAE